MELKVEKILFELNRMDKNMSWLAYKLGTSRQWVYELLIKEPKASRTFRTLEKLGTALDIEPKDLLR
jgi:DNA-binding Xre family transcriptional regulator